MKPRSLLVVIESAQTGAAQIQKAVAELGSDRRILLLVEHEDNSVVEIAALLSQTDKIHGLFWVHERDEEVDSIFPLLADLRMLSLDFAYHCEFSVATRALRRLPKLRELTLGQYKDGDLQGFFAALEKSNVTVLKLTLTKALLGPLLAYLKKDLLDELHLTTLDKGKVPESVLCVLANCKGLVKLGLNRYILDSTTFAGLPASVTELQIRHCTFQGEVDWSFLARSSVRELVLLDTEAVSLPLPELKRLRLADPDWEMVDEEEEDWPPMTFANRPLDWLGFGQGDLRGEALSALDFTMVKSLEIFGALSDQVAERIVHALTTPGNELRCLALGDDPGTVDCIQRRLRPALQSPHCRLVFIATRGAHPAAAELQVILNNRESL